MSAPPPTNIPNPESAASPTYPVPEAPRAPQAPPPIPPVPPTPPKSTNTALIITLVAIVVLVPVALCVGAALLAGAGLFVTSRQMSNLVERTATSQFQFAVPSHPSITVFDTAGQVTITSGAGEQITVVATKHARATTSQNAQNMLDDMEVAAVPAANGATINANLPQSSAFNQRTVDLRITVPRTSDLTVTVNAGTITMTSVTGVFNVKNSAGTVSLQDVTAQGATTVNVATGTFRFDGELAKDAMMAATVNMGNANIRLPDASATHFDATTNVGSINVTGWAATIQKSGAGQSAAFDLNPQPTSTMTVHVDVGSITLAAR